MICRAAAACSAGLRFPAAPTPDRAGLAADVSQRYARTSPPARAQAAGTAVCGHGAVVSDSYPAMCVPLLMVPDVTIPRSFAGTHPGYPPPDGVCGDRHRGKLGGDRALPREVFESSHRTGEAVRGRLHSVTSRLTCSNRL